MKVIEPGHIYELEWQDGLASERSDPLVFVNREPGHEHGGTQTQEVLRALIDRTYHCDGCMPHPLNGLIIQHLRMALVYHEMRALERKTEKGELRPELATTGSDGHFALTSPACPDPNLAPRREFELGLRQPECKRRDY